MRIGVSRRVLGLLIGIGLIVSTASFAAQEPADDATADDAMPKPSAKLKTKAKVKSGSKARRPATKKNLGKGASKQATDMDEMPADAPANQAASAGNDDDSTIKFSRDIAPILVGNCISCHNPKDKAKRKEFDLTTFAALMKGGADGPAIAPGKPEESALLLRIKGEETPKMPPGQNNLGGEAIAKIEQWIKDGAILDRGIDPAADLAKVAPTPDMLRRDALAKLSPEERDEKAKGVALERWQKASSKTTPEMTSDKHFLAFGNLPADRAKNLLKVLEAEYLTVGRLLGPLAATTAIGGPEKISVYVFNDSNSYVEFVRGLENRELDSTVESHANFGVETPYIAVVDPLHGGAETPAPRTPSKKTSRTKRAAADGDDGGPGRSLAGLASESLGVGVISGAGQPPKWLSLGVGAYLASQVEPRSPYVRELRSEAYTAFDQGASKVREAIGDEGEAGRLKAVGFSLIECLATTAKAGLPMFVREVAAGGGGKFDQAAEDVFYASPQQFLDNWGGFVARHYGRGR